MKNLFKIFVVAILFFAVSEASAQMSAGIGVVYGTDIDNIGFSANGKYEFNEKWAAAPSFTYFLKKNCVNWSALDLDANYSLTEIENIGSLYAIGGLSVNFVKVKFDYDFGAYGGSGSTSASSSDAGLNLGLGLNIASNEKFAIAPEIKYTIMNGGYLRAGVKIMFGL